MRLQDTEDSAYERLASPRSDPVSVLINVTDWHKNIFRAECAR